MIRDGYGSVECSIAASVKDIEVGCSVGELINDDEILFAIFVDVSTGENIAEQRSSGGVEAMESSVPIVEQDGDSAIFVRRDEVDRSIVVEIGANEFARIGSHVIGGRSKRLRGKQRRQRATEENEKSAA